MTNQSSTKVCPLCERTLIPGDSINEHHLIPKTFKGRETVTMHVICHSKIHSVFTERELFQYYHTIERLKSHPEIQKFIRWIAKKAPDYKSKNRTMKRKGRR